MGALIDRDQQLRLLIDAGVAFSSELSLDDLLARVTEAAATLTGARYAALGVVDERGTSLERFVTHGIEPELRQEIGDLPVGRGILGVLIKDARALRLHDMTRDPRSVGVPPGHPPMRSFLGVPILMRGIVYGNLYLTEKEGADEFTAQDEELATLLAAQAAVAIENARLFAASVRWIGQLESLAEIGNALGGELELRRVLQLIVARMREVVQARLAMVIMPRADGVLTVEAADGEGADRALGISVASGSSKAAAVMARRRSERIDAVMDDLEFDRASVRRLGFSSAMYVPLVLDDRVLGVVSVHDKEARDRRFADSDLRLVELFADRAAVAIDLSRRIERDTLQTFLRAQELERGRFARELHDETGQALTAILLSLSSLNDCKTKEGLDAAVHTVRERTVAALDNVRRLAFELRPKALDDFGLHPALQRLVETTAEQSGLRIDFTGPPPERLDADVETAVYRTVQEALTNVIKHAGATQVSIVLGKRANVLTVVVEDDGAGFDCRAVASDRFGLTAMTERLGLLDGTVTIDSRPGHGTTLRATVPLT